MAQPRSHIPSPNQGPALFAEGQPVGVLTLEPLGKPLDYRAPAGGCAMGAVVLVPLGPRQVLGVVWGPARGDFAPARLRSITEVLGVPPLGADLREFLSRAADYTLTPPDMMLRLAMRVPGLGQPLQARRVYRAAATAPDTPQGTRQGTPQSAGPAPRMTEARAKVLAVFADRSTETCLTLSELCAEAGTSSSVVKGMVAAGLLLEAAAPRDLPYPRLDPSLPARTLAPDQERAARALRAAQAQRQYGTTLLKGVTGSGKTEVYLEAVAECLAQGRQALVLLPEIALTAGFLARVEQRFGARPAEWHSGISQTERRRLWHMVAEGGADLVVGARSALFLPYRDLGLIVVDEEHDGSYKQDEVVFYNARDMAVLRAAICQAQVVLASATPSLETWVNAQQGKYARLDLSSRFGTAELPQMRALDLRLDPPEPGRWISPPLEAAVRERLSRQEQSLLFLNRRGYAPVTLCRACGQQIGCSHCDARMVEHRFLKRLICHQCGESRPLPSACPACGVEGKLAPLGPGVERLAEEVAAVFPQARVAVLSSDLFGSAKALKEAIESIAAGGADILIGTQLVAKGHNFPLLTLVGVIDADLGLQGSDLRAAEHSFQLMRQVAGRAGRAEKPGLALLQSYQPEHPVIRAILGGDEEAFWQAESAARQAAGMPPFGRMAGIILSSPDLAAAEALGLALARQAGPLQAIGAQVFGPAPAPIARIRGRHRIRLLVKAPKSAPLQGAIAAWLAPVKRPTNLRLSVDIDPQSFL